MTTLEARVEQRLAEFTAAASEVPGRRQAVADLEALVTTIDPVHDSSRLYEAKRDLRLAREELRRLESRDDEIQYLLDIAPFVKEYDTVEAVDETAKPTAPTSLLESFVSVTHKNSKNLVLQKYLAEIEKQPDAMNNKQEGKRYRLGRGLEAELTCEACDSYMVINGRESSLVCTNCGVSRDFIEMSEANLSYEQEVATDVVNYFAYKRLNHFTEWLNSLQAKENTDIPVEIVEAVKAEFKKARTTTRGEIKPAKVREYLKKLKLNKVGCAAVNIGHGHCGVRVSSSCVPGCRNFLGTAHFPAHFAAHFAAHISRGDYRRLFTMRWMARMLLADIWTCSCPARRRLSSVFSALRMPAGRRAGLALPREGRRRRALRGVRTRRRVEIGI